MVIEDVIHPDTSAGPAIRIVISSAVVLSDQHKAVISDQLIMRQISHVNAYIQAKRSSDINGGNNQGDPFVINRRRQKLKMWIIVIVGCHETRVYWIILAYM